MRRLFPLALLVSCKLEPARPPSYFDGAYKARRAPVPATCHDMLGCYGRCNPFTEECQGRCDRQGAPDDAAHARAAMTCFEQAACSDEKCVNERCGAELAACGSGARPCTCSS